MWSSNDKLCSPKDNKKDNYVNSKNAFVIIIEKILHRFLRSGKHAFNKTSKFNVHLTKLLQLLGHKVP